MTYTEKEINLGVNLAIYLTKVDRLVINRSPSYRLDRSQIITIRRLVSEDNKSDLENLLKILDVNPELNIFKKIAGIELPNNVEALNFSRERVSLDLRYKIEEHNVRKMLSPDQELTRIKYTDIEYFSILSKKREVIAFLGESGLRQAPLAIVVEPKDRNENPKLILYKIHLDSMILGAKLLFPDAKEFPLKIPEISLERIFVEKNGWNSDYSLVG